MGGNGQAASPALDIDQYLAFGFDTDIGTRDPLHLLRAWSGPRRHHREPADLDALIREGIATQAAAFEECAAQTDGRRDQVVLLSGGLDSRVILGSLLELYPSRQIVAVTFGRPGETDYDLGARVAERARVRHLRIETFSVAWTTQGLVDSILARGAPSPFPFGQRYLSYEVHRQIGHDAVYWDGLCGDVVSGGLLPRAGEPWDWVGARAKWIATHVRRGALAYTRLGFDPDRCVPADPWYDEAYLSYPEQLDYILRQGRYISTRVLRDYDVHTPFLRQPFLDYWFGLPEGVRERDQIFYQEVQKAAFPQLFALPSTSTPTPAAPVGPIGRTMRAVRRRLRPSSEPAYETSGANGAIRSARRWRADIRDLFMENLTDLRARRLVDLAPITARAAGSDEIDDKTACALLDVELNIKALSRPEYARRGIGARVRR